MARLMKLSHYRFRSVWTVDASPDEAAAVLRDLNRYPQWWPEIKESHRLDDDRFLLRVKSLLPYYLEFVSERSRDEPAAGVLEARLIGDLDGFSRWTVSADDNGARLVFEEEVVTSKRWLNLLAPVARPAFKFNHALMMRRGEAGLRAFLAGLRFGHERG
jgi:hypothetical protein